MEGGPPRWYPCARAEGELRSKSARQRRPAMASENGSKTDAGRRDALKTLGAAALAASGGMNLLGSGTAAAASATPGPAATKTAGGPHNILFILTDQERFFRPGELP